LPSGKKMRWIKGKMGPGGQKKTFHTSKERYASICNQAKKKVRYLPKGKKKTAQSGSKKKEKWPNSRRRENSALTMAAVLQYTERGHDKKKGLELKKDNVAVQGKG